MASEKFKLYIIVISLLILIQHFEVHKLAFNIIKINQINNKMNNSINLSYINEILNNKKI